MLLPRSHGLLTAEPETAEVSRPVGLLLPDAEADMRANLVAGLRTLADAMMTPAPPDASAKKTPPAITTYLGQFIDHDITALQLTEIGETFDVGNDTLVPLPRKEAANAMRNGRTGALDLDSVYGDGPRPDGMNDELAVLLKKLSCDHEDPAHLRVGHLVAPTRPDSTPVRQPGEAGDLPRLGQALADPHWPGLEDQLRALTAGDMRRTFFRGLGDQAAPRHALALIGDARNDENLIVAQLHLSFMLFHNAIVDTASGAHAEARFQAAREQTRRVYQRIVYDEWLPAVCDPDILGRVKAERAPLYTRLRETAAPHGSGLPMPLEFSAGAFRFGHSMVRPAYDFNETFGRTMAGDDGPAPPARLAQLFAFTGRGRMDLRESATGFALPADWAPDWARLLDHGAEFPDRLALPIDTSLAKGLDDMSNEVLGFRHLARLNLIRGYWLSLPTGQSARDAIQRFDEARGAPADPSGISADDLRAGPHGDILADHGFDKATPLWYYILHEAAVTADGAHLGPLGSRIVAETIVGLLVHDPASILNAPSPENACSLADIGSFEELLRVAGLLR